MHLAVGSQDIGQRDRVEKEDNDFEGFGLSKIGGGVGGVSMAALIATRVWL